MITEMKAHFEEMNVGQEWMLAKMEANSEKVKALREICGSLKKR
jgi:hypothetical protein